MAEKPPAHYERVAQFWDDVTADMERTAAEYREEGWDTVALDVGDVTALEDEEGRPGLSVLVPDNEFERIESYDPASFEAFDVYRRVEGDLAFVVVVDQNPSAGVAVLYPAYYHRRHDEGVLDAVRERGECWTFLRTLDESSRLALRHEPAGGFLAD